MVNSEEILNEIIMTIRHIEEKTQSPVSYLTVLVNSDHTLDYSLSQFLDITQLLLEHPYLGYSARS